MRAPSCVYQLHALRAAGAPDALDGAGPAGDGLDRLGAWLDHVAHVGCDAVLLTPIFRSSTHGYDTIDALAIDPRLGDDAAFDRFVAGCRERGLRLLLDGVLNHVGPAFPRLDEWARRDGGDVRLFEGHPGLITLDHANPAVLDWAVGQCRHWLDRGAGGWRFDAAYAIPRPFLRALVDELRTSHPAAYLFGEVIHGDYAGFVAETGLDAVTQYELHKATWSACNDGNLFELAWALQRHAEIAATFRPVTFVGNHDVTRIASQLTEPAHLAVVLAALFTIPGTPCVYYGDELAWRGLKEHRAGGDDAIRPALPADGFPTDAEQEAALGLHRVLIGIRRDRPWLADGALEVGAPQNRTLGLTVTGTGERRLRVDLDLDAEPPEAPGWTTVLARRGLRISEPA